MLTELTAVAAAAGGDSPFAGMVFDEGLTWLHAVRVLWLLLVALAPTVSLVFCIRAWVTRRGNQGTGWAPRVIFAAAFLMFATTTVTALGRLRGFCLSADGFASGADASAAWSVALANLCDILLVGFAASSVCLLCALCLPLRHHDASSASPTGR